MNFSGPGSCYLLFEPYDRGEFINWDARDVDGVLNGACVSITYRHTTGDDLGFVDRQMPADNRVILSQKNLRAGIEASGLCGKHESLSEKPAVEPAIHFHSSVHREEGGNWRIIENEVSRYIPAARFHIGPVDAECAIEYASK